jgi:hypothetical protein
MPSQRDLDRLATLLASVSKDPYQFVLLCFPWGVAGTELENHFGPDAWQEKILKEIRDGLRTVDEIIREAVASGYGVGKSALVSWIILWSMSTMTDCRGVVTANTETQLKTKTWAELAKWHRMFIGEHMFSITATSMYSSDPKHERTWRMDAVPWSEKNPQAFQGLHNKNKRLLLIFDEAADIADLIWEAAEGALTDSDTEIIWAVFGNPSFNNGRFRACFGRYSHRWKTHHVDGRKARMSNKKLYEEWAADHGVESDYFKTHVLGQFPDASSGQFISIKVAEDAASKERDIQPTVYDPLIMGVDCARFGCFDDQTEILTDAGWKLFSALVGSEQVLTLNGDDAEWGPIEQIHCYPFVGTMNLYESVRLNFCITDNHKLLVRSHQKSERYVLRRYDELPEDYMVRAWSNWRGTPIGHKEFVTTKEMPHGGEMLYRHTFSGVDWCAFMGWFLSEGSVYVEPRHRGRHRVCIAQMPGAKQDQIKDLLTRMGIKWRIVPDGHVIEFTSKSIGAYLLSACGHGAANKRVPCEVKNASQEEIEAFLLAYRLGDGCAHAGDTGISYWTTSAGMADDLQEMLGKVGRAGSLGHSHRAGTQFMIGDRSVTRLNDVYVVNERSPVARQNPQNKNRDRFLKKSHAKRMPYSGNVWCVSTPHKTIYVRRNGKPMWSGNSDQSVIRFRRGRDARSILPVKFRNIDTMELAAQVCAQYDLHHPDAVFIDVGGPGAGVVDRCRQLRVPVIEVAFGSRALPRRDEGAGTQSYYNLRAQMWGLMKDWLVTGMIDDDPDLIRDLTNVQYEYRALEGIDAILLERKADMRMRGLDSPDNGDALAITWAYPVQSSDHTAILTSRLRSPHESEYQPMGEAWRVGRNEGQSSGQNTWMPHGDRWVPSRYR